MIHAYRQILCLNNRFLQFGRHALNVHLSTPALGLTFFDLCVFIIIQKTPPLQER
jgi:hypothetical protein